MCHLLARLETSQRISVTRTQEGFRRRARSESVRAVDLRPRPQPSRAPSLCFMPPQKPSVILAAVLPLPGTLFSAGRRRQRRPGETMAGIRESCSTRGMNSASSGAPEVVGARLMSKTCSDVARSHCHFWCVVTASHVAQGVNPGYNGHLCNEACRRRLGGAYYKNGLGEG